MAKTQITPTPVDRVLVAVAAWSDNEIVIGISKHHHECENAIKAFKRACRKMVPPLGYEIRHYILGEFHKGNEDQRYLIVEEFDAQARKRP